MEIILDNSDLKEFLENIGATTDEGRKLIKEGKFSLLIYEFQGDSDSLDSYFDVYDEYDMDAILNVINSRIGTNFTDYLKEIDRAKYIIKGRTEYGEHGLACFHCNYTRPYINGGVSAYYMGDITASASGYLLAFETESEAQKFIDTHNLKYSGYGEVVKYEIIPLDRGRSTWPFIKTKEGVYMYSFTLFWESTIEEYERMIGNILDY